MEASAVSRALLVLTSTALRERAIDWIHRAPTGTRVEFKAAKRTLPQNAKLHAMLTDISRQHTINGRRYSVVNFKLMFLTAYAEEIGMELKHLPAINRAGMIPCGRSSSDLSVEEMTGLIEWMLAWGVENDIVWSDPALVKETEHA